jgi:hypothetical protein
MSQEIRKTTDIELLQFFVSGTEGIFIGEELKLKFTGSNRKIYYKNTVAATLEYEGKILAAQIDRNFLFFPELDNLLRDLGFFQLTTDSKAATYSSYTPKNYRAQYTLPNILWKAWILNCTAKDKEKLFFLHNEEWLEIEDLSFSGIRYLISLKTEKRVEIQEGNKILWSDRKPSSTIRIWSSTVKSYTTVPIFRPQQIPSVLEIEKDSMIATGDFWRVVRVLNDKLESSDSKFAALMAKYNNAKKVFQQLKVELTTWQKKEETLRDSYRELEARLARRDAKIALYSQSIEMYQRAIAANNIALPTSQHTTDF